MQSFIHNSLYMYLVLVFGLFVTITCAASFPTTNSSHGLAVRAFLQAERLATCSYLSDSGTFPLEGEWQSGNTLEALAEAVLLLQRTAAVAAPGRDVTWSAVLANSYAKTPDVFGGDCFDDHQWCTSLSFCFFSCIVVVT